MDASPVAFFHKKLSTFLMVRGCIMQRLWRNSPNAIFSRPRTLRWTCTFSSQYHVLSPLKHGSISGKRVEYQPEHKSRLYNFQRTRTFGTTAIPSILVPPLIFFGLLISLWTWKCFWIVILQDKLLYLSWLPPLARSEKIADYERECQPVQWTEKRIQSLDRTKLAVCEGHIPLQRRDGRTTVAQRATVKRKSVVICYFQGNGGSTPLRLPLLSQVLRMIDEKSKSHPSPTYSSDATEYTVVALSYRGYWTSSGRATQSGIELDAQSFLNWVSETYASPDTDLEVILWGHSLGSAIASAATATYLSHHSGHQAVSSEIERARPINIAGLVLEAPSSSIKDMLISLYPQKWLPYRYLWPFSWNHWSCTTAMERIASWRDQNEHHSKVSPPPILLLSAENDEVIPPHVADGLESDSQRLGLKLERKTVPGALHTEAPVKLDGREALVNFILKNTSPGRNAV
ncbi:hypothetical protein ETB97_006146 [Aspergillus alliaceus]|uniref:AB hydrolase-1 domain-containing protein n=1 Tax=Petromyces alliaceus TaxID=209559 RepID=A0A8H6EA05_PETAA|nr:hypothetical protein ETB97_006146 [Aspergillus burnettii]